MMTTTLVLTALLACIAPAAASDGPVSPEAKRWHPDRNWLRGAFCIHRHESINWHIHNHPYANGMQFLLSTWIRAGGRAEWWITAGPREQLYRAYVIWRSHGGSWSEWSTRGRCGLA